MEKQKKILIVEDDEHISKIYKIKLANDGVLVLIALDGEEALAKIIEERPDLVVLDVMLPKKDGFWVLEQLKKKPELSKIPVIMLSNLGQKVDQDRAIALGAREYLVKVDSPIQTVIAKMKAYIGMAQP
ncbi:MAG: response regulator [Candidatus Pacebacteria bacterium]|nr:response regulator [Candidatus Paceibacterota bacterium]